MTTDHHGCHEGGGDLTEVAIAQIGMKVKMIGTLETEGLTEGEGEAGVSADQGEGEVEEEGEYCLTFTIVLANSADEKLIIFLRK